jgi:exodeoxyribonuclease VII small subunit
MFDQPLEQLPYEQAYSELEEIVSALEIGEQSLEQALALFERGQALARHCASLLDRADLKVQQIAGKEILDFNVQG